MEICCAYIKDDSKNIKEKLFNFSNKYNFEYDLETNTLECTENENYIEGFWGDKISSLSIIVGANASGKSNSIIWLLEKITYGFNSENFNNGFIIFSEGDEFYFSGDELKFKFHNKKDKLQSTLNPFEDKISLKSMFYEGNVDFNREESVFSDWKGISNISSKFLFQYDYQGDAGEDWSTPELAFHRVQNSHKIQNSYRVAKFITETKNNDFNFLESPKYLHIRPNDSYYRNIVTPKKEEYDYFADIRTELEQYYNAIERNSAKENLIKEYFIASMSSAIYQRKYYFPQPNSPKNAYPIINKELKGFILNDSKREGGNNIFEFLKELVKAIPKGEENVILNNEDESTQNEKTMYYAYNMAMKKYLNSIIKFLEILNTNIDTVLINKKHYNHLYMDLNIEDASTLLYKIFAIFKADDYVGSLPLSFVYSHSKHKDGTMSSGEMQMFNLFSRISYYKYGGIMSSGTPNLIILDEPDIGIHPQWQKEFIDLLCKFINQTFEDPIQIIITTHSPIILSDIPNYAVNYMLRDGEDKSPTNKTFASNIFDLYKNDFFLKGGFVGKFAQSKIKELKKLMDEGETDKIKKIINLVGDSVLKSILQAEYLDLDDKIDELKQRIAELEKKKGEIMLCKK